MNRKEVHNCLNCGSDITHRSQQALYCNESCLKQYKYKTTKSIKKQCSQCGSEFETKNNADYCSQTCVGFSRGKNKDVVKRCAYCGVGFPVKYVLRNSKKCCSRSCASKYLHQNLDEETRTQMKAKQSEKAKMRTGQKNAFYGKQHSDQTKEALSSNRKGKYLGSDNPNWRGGSSFVQQVLRAMPEYESWRKKVYKRDGQCCQICGRIDGPFHADHIIPFSYILREHSIKTTEDARKCDILWSIANGRVLCVKCHRETDTYGAGAQNYEE